MKIKKVNKIITILIIILIVVLFSLIFKIIKELKNEVKETVTLDIIENYNYKLMDNDTNYFKEEFRILKKNLENEKINEEEYAKSIAKLFIIDFYSLSSAINKNDVGGVQFIKSDSQEIFIKKAKDSIYNNVENNMYEDRKQVLPNVKQVDIISIENKKQEKDSNTYKITSMITYDEDLGYATSIEITLVQHNNLLEITSLKENRN